MGYDKININSGSSAPVRSTDLYAAPCGTLRTAYLTSLVILEDRVPLYLMPNRPTRARSVVQGLRRRRCLSCGLFTVRTGFRQDHEQDARHPVSAFVHHPVTGARTEIHLTEWTFADCVRVMMYRTPRDVPFLIEKAAAGDFRPFAEAGLKANRGVYEGGGMGFTIASLATNSLVGLNRTRSSPRRAEVISEPGEFATRWRPASIGPKRN